MPTLLFLGGSVSQLPAIRHARLAGYRIVVVDGDPNAVAFPLAHASRPVDFSDVDQVVEVARSFRVDGILSICTDRGVVPAAAAAAALGLPGMEVAVARRMTDKSAMRARLAERGLRQPAHAVVGSAGDIPTALAAVGLPAVLKPVDSGGQRGLFMVHSEADAVGRLDQTLAMSARGAAVLEAYVEGLELNVLLVMRAGTPTLLTISDRLRPGGAGFGVGWIHSFPSSLPDRVLNEVRDAANASVSALGLRDGIAFPQLIAATDGVYVVEVAARIAAGQMADLVRLGTGIELFDIAIAQALGRDVPDSLVARRFTRPIAIRFLTAEPGVLPVGEVKEVEGLEIVRASPGVLACGLYFDVGAQIRPLQVDADRSGYVIATGASPEQALQLADAAARRLVVRTAEGECRPATRFGRLRRSHAVALAVVAVLLLATTSALVLTEAAKLQRPLVTGTRVDNLFAPLCRCAHDVAHLRFRLTGRARVTIQMATHAGRPVATFVQGRLLGPGLVRFIWAGRKPRGRGALADGSYFPEVNFLSLHRRLMLPSPISIDDRRPAIVRVADRARKHVVVIRYTFDEPAHAVLIAAGKRVIFSRFAARSGSLTWKGNPTRLALEAIDLAGNRSRVRPVT